VPHQGHLRRISIGRFADDHDANEIFVTDIIGRETSSAIWTQRSPGTREGITGIQLDLKARG